MYPNSTWNTSRYVLKYVVGGAGTAKVFFDISTLPAGVSINIYNTRVDNPILKYDPAVGFTLIKNVAYDIWFEYCMSDIPPQSFDTTVELRM
jgi:hypothetical protein